MLEVKFAEQHAEVSIPVTGSVVCEHAATGDAEAAEVCARQVEEELGGGAGLIGQDGGEGDAGVIVHSDVEVLVAGAAGLAGAVRSVSTSLRQVASEFRYGPGDRWCILF